MCRNLILLAQNDRQQMIFTCEHGVHITHQKTTLWLTNGAFHEFTHLLAEGNLAAINESTLGSVREGSNGLIELWIGSGGFRLHADEFFSLSDLLRTAARRLDRLPPTHTAHTKSYLN